MRENHREVAEIKRHIRATLNMAAVRGEIDGIDAFAILQTIAAEFVARCCCEEHRRYYIDAVRDSFGPHVERELLRTEGMAQQ